MSEEVYIEDIEVDWRAGWGNRPGFNILFNRLPESNELKYHNENGLYYARKGAYVSFYAHNKDNPEENAGGFYGRVFEINVAGKGLIKLKGPWSSRAGCMNKQGFDACADASITDSLKVMKGKGTFYAGAVAIGAIEDWIREHDDEINWLIVQKIGRDGEITYEPRLKDNDNPCLTCKGLKEYSWLGKIETCKACNGSGKHEWVRLGDLANELRIQTQYLSYYIGGLNTYPDLSEGLSFEMNDCYHSIRIWYEDRDEFVKRVMQHREEK